MNIDERIGDGWPRFFYLLGINFDFAREKHGLRFLAGFCQATLNKEDIQPSLFRFYFGWFRGHCLTCEGVKVI